MPGDSVTIGEDALRNALQLMTQALDVLDGGGGPPQVATLLELAIAEAKLELSGSTD